MVLIVPVWERDAVPGCVQFERVTDSTSYLSVHLKDDGEWEGKHEVGFPNLPAAVLGDAIVDHVDLHMTVHWEFGSQPATGLYPQGRRFETARGRWTEGLRDIP